MKCILPFFVVLILAVSISKQIPEYNFLQSTESGIFSGVGSELEDGSEYEIQVPSEHLDDIELVIETKEVDDMMNDLDDSTIKSDVIFSDGLQEVQEIADELDEDQYVLINDESYTSEEVTDLIDEAEYKHELGTSAFTG